MRAHFEVGQNHAPRTSRKPSNAPEVFPDCRAFHIGPRTGGSRAPNGTTELATRVPEFWLSQFSPNCPHPTAIPRKFSGGFLSRHPRKRTSNAWLGIATLLHPPTQDPLPSHTPKLKPRPHSPTPPPKTPSVCPKSLRRQGHPGSGQDPRQQGGGGG